jgi:hypothetical protein
MILGSNKSFIDSDGVAILLNHSTTDQNFYLNRDIEHVSIITGVKTHSVLGDYQEFTVIERCWQEENPAEKMNEILSLRGQLVNFYLFGSSLIANCFVSYIKPFYFRDLKNYDACVIFLQPTLYQTLGSIVDDTGQAATDDTGATLGIY